MSDAINDYAMPMMRIERLLRQIHDLCLKRDYQGANDLTPNLITEARILQATLTLMAAEKK